MTETLTPYGIIDDILGERERQDEKWGPDREIEPLYWLAILMEEVGEAAKEVIEPLCPIIFTPELRREVVQVAAVAIAWLEAMDRTAGAG